MKTYKIYTAGKMAGLSYDEQMYWRREIEYYIFQKTDKTVTFIHPPLFYRYDNPSHQSEKEVKDWDISQLRDSDIIIVNLKGIGDSTGTHFELSMVDAINSFGNKHIYVIGIGESEKPLHPWIELSLHRKEPDFESAADYITEYLLL